MLSVAPLAGGPGYYLELASINYYVEGGEPPPLWHGTAAKEFGLSGVAEKEHVYSLCAGLHHEEEGKNLVRNAGKEERNPGHDLTFSAPKSVSVAWAMADPELRKAIEEKQLQAVRQALDYIEDKAGFARVGKDGQRLVKCPLFFALFEHGTSRAMDPQLHTHALCINLTMHPDGRTTAMDSTYLYHFKMAAGAVYRAALAHGMQQLGLEVEQRQLGTSRGFELSCIPKAIIEEFSKRRAEIEETLKLRNGGLDTASPKYAELVTKETRRTKDTEKPRAELLEEWQALGRTTGIDADYVRKQLSPHARLTPEERAARKEEVFKEAIAALSEGHAHWNEADLTKAVAERAAGRITARDVRELVEHKLRGPELIPLGGLQTERRNQELKQYIDRVEERYSTPEIQALERKMLVDVERVARGPRSESRPALVEGAIAARESRGQKLDPEQADAVRWLCSGPGVRLLSGIAGTGKTWTIETCREVWHAEGREVLGCAVAGKAAKVLQEKTGIPSDTVLRTLWLLDQGQLTLKPNSVLLVDEAGMLGTRQLARLVEHVRDAKGARLVLVGDAKQLQPIEAGGPFKYLSGVLGEARLTTIRRQEEKWMREAVRSFEKGKAREAIASYIEHGCFHVKDTRKEALAAVIERWKADGGVKDPSRVFVLASLNAEVKELNLQAQAARILEGEVDADRKLYANGVFFHVGDRLQFQKRSRAMGVENSDTATVLDVDPGRERIKVRLDEEGREVMVDLKKYSGSNLRLGYASTTHKAQGDTIPHVHVLMGGPLTDLHMGYVQASRSVISTHLFCDKHTVGNPELSDLIRSLSHERQKTMAQEVMEQAHRRQQERGMSLGM